MLQNCKFGQFYYCKCVNNSYGSLSVYEIVIENEMSVAQIRCIFDDTSI